MGLNIASRLGIAGKYDDKLRPFIRLKTRLRIYFRAEPKVFVIGLNKTGTTSVFTAIQELGLDMSNQHDAERIFNDILNGTKTDQDLFKYCKYHEAFQDIPFSVPGYFKILDKKFPKSKFILNVRDNDEVWYNSFHKYYGDMEAIKKSKYISNGFLYSVFQHIFNTNVFNKEICTTVYRNHINDVKDYFKTRPEDLLVLNVSKQESYIEMCDFIEKVPLRDTFEWKNKTKSLED